MCKIVYNTPHEHYSFKIILTQVMLFMDNHAPVNGLTHMPYLDINYATESTTTRTCQPKSNDG